MPPVRLALLLAVPLLAAGCLAAPAGPPGAAPADGDAPAAPGWTPSTVMDGSFTAAALWGQPCPERADRPWCASGARIQTEGSTLHALDPAATGFLWNVTWTPRSALDAELIVRLVGPARGDGDAGTVAQMAGAPRLRASVPRESLRLGSDDFFHVVPAGPFVIPDVKVDTTIQTTAQAA